MVHQGISHWAVLVLLTSPAWAGLDGQQVCSIGQTSCPVVVGNCGGYPACYPDNSVHCSVSCTSIGQNRSGEGYVKAEGGRAIANCSAHSSGQGKDVHPCPSPFNLATYAYLFASQTICAQSSQIQVSQRSCMAGGSWTAVTVAHGMAAVCSQSGR